MEAIDLWEGNSMKEVEKDQEAAISKLSAIAEEDLDSLRLLAQWHLSMDAIEEAVVTWKTAVTTFQHVESMMLIAEYYYSNGELDETVEYWTLAAGHQHPKAILNLAQYYQSRDICFDIESDLYKYTKLAADLGCSKSLRLLAEWSTLIEDEDSEPTNQVDLFVKAGVAGDIQSYIRAAYILYHGIGVPRDGERAMTLFLKAARSASNPSLVSLGHAYSTGQEGLVNENPEKAFQLYSEGLLTGDTNAYLYLAHCQWTGKGCDQNRELARENYHRAVDNGVNIALPCLARCYVQMDHVDRVRARSYLSKFIAENMDECYKKDLSGEVLDKILDEME
ncbi:hypothetical protein BC833DRAFT_617951 [Globomyces pollinis-pini]|nr:hypothetical protein BC833DRAFT_617951 [Globomyces pollinis-pini]